ncbi:MAG TPA: TrkA family potassium uptake protein [Pyrinomonadaceae bacterium]|nr:TrkA family potassium uptake protein [Pyrinomonadaceae bacterium]
MERNFFAVVGLGHFGSHVARVLYEAGKNVIAIDMDEEAVQDAAECATRAVVADATDRQTLVSLGIPDVDAAIISLGEKMDVIVLAALQFIELGVPYVAVKALTEDHAKILHAIGVHEVIHPEKEMAIRLASRLARKDVVDFLPIAPGYSIREIKAPPEFVGKSLSELALRNTLHVQLIAIERNRTKDELDINIVPRAGDVIQADDILVLLGKNRDLDRITDIVNKSRA